MKAILIVMVLSVLLVMGVFIFFGSETSIGEYHNLSTLGEIAITNMKDDAKVIHISGPISISISDYILEIKPDKTYEANNSKEKLTSINYLIVTNSYYYTIGENYIIMSIKSESDNNMTVETIHIVDHKIIDELEEIIEVQLKRAN